MLLEIILGFKTAGDPEQILYLTSFAVTFKNISIVTKKVINKASNVNNKEYYVALNLGSSLQRNNSRKLWSKKMVKSFSNL